MMHRALFSCILLAAWLTATTVLAQSIADRDPAKPGNSLQFAQAQTDDESEQEEDDEEEEEEPDCD